MRKKLVLLCTFICSLLMLTNNVKAASDIGTNGVNLDFALDYCEQKIVRLPEQVITDNGLMKNPYDTLDIGMLYDDRYDLDYYKSIGYKTVVLEVTMEVKEVHHGYQYILFFDDVNENTWLAGGQFDLGHNVKVTTYTELTFYCEIDIANIKNNDIVVRYAASGGLDDDWKNRNVTCQIGLSMQPRKTSRVWQLQWTSSTAYSYMELPNAT